MIAKILSSAAGERSRATSINSRFSRERPPAFGDRPPGSHRPLGSRCGGIISTVLPTYLTYHYLLALLKRARREALRSAQRPLAPHRALTDTRVTGTPFRRSVIVRRPWASVWVTNRRPHNPSGGGGSRICKRLGPCPASRGIKVLPYHCARAYCRFSRRLEHARQRYTSMCEDAASQCADNAERH
jgi:hypothetical protein